MGTLVIYLRHFKLHLALGSKQSVMWTTKPRYIRNNKIIFYDTAESRTRKHCGLQVKDFDRLSIEIEPFYIRLVVLGTIIIQTTRESTYLIITLTDGRTRHKLIWEREREKVKNPGWKRQSWLPNWNMRATRVFKYFKAIWVILCLLPLRLSYGPWLLRLDTN